VGIPGLNDMLAVYTCLMLCFGLVAALNLLQKPPCASNEADSQQVREPHLMVAGVVSSGDQQGRRRRKFSGEEPAADSTGVSWRMASFMCKNNNYEICAITHLHMDT